MTEEQKFEEYRNKNCKRWETDGLSVDDIANEVYLAGYHEGFKDCAKARLNVTTISDCPIKYEWHDLRKNPKDLPTEDCKDYLAIGLDDTEPSIYMYLAGDDETEGQWEWEPRRIASLSNDQIKAWCEIPTFEEDA